MVEDVVVLGGSEACETEVAKNIRLSRNKENVFHHSVLIISLLKRLTGG